MVVLYGWCFSVIVVTVVLNVHRKKSEEVLDPMTERLRFILPIFMSPSVFIITLCKPVIGGYLLIYRVSSRWTHQSHIVI